MDENSPLVDAIGKFEKLTGVAPPTGGSWSGSMGEWKVRDAWEELREALELDPTELTANFLFSVLVKEYLAARSATMLDLLNDEDGDMMGQIALARELLAIVNRPEIAKAREDFKESIRIAIGSYRGAEARPDLEKLLANHGSLAILRRDALRSMKKLRVDQFLRGPCEPDDVRPTYLPKVYGWWNINSLLNAALSMPSGVGIHFVRDPNAYESYFVFSIRNGSNLYVLSDVPEHAHPLAAEMARKPGRDMDRRIAKNWFPYEVLDLQTDEKGDSYFKQHSDAKGVVPYQPDHTPLKWLSEIEPAPLVWCTLMFELILKRFWKDGFQAPQLSYTGEMLKVETRLLDQARAAGLPMVLDERLGLQELTLADVTGPDLDQSQIGRTHDFPNAWLEARYKDRIAPETLNLLGAPAEAVNLEGGEVVRRTSQEVKALGYFEARDLAKSQTRLVQLAGTRFGSPEQLEADRRFIARYNVAKQINLLTEQEYAARKAEVLAWWQARLLANKDQIISWCLGDDVWVEDTEVAGGRHHSNAGGSRVLEAQPPKPGAFTDTFSSRKRMFRGFIRHYNIEAARKDVLGAGARLYGGTSIGGGRTNARGHDWHQTCAVNDARAADVVVIYPGSATELAALAACAPEALPDVLQHFSLVDRYRGNSNLDRIDPMIWKVDNPWSEKLDLTVRVPFSVSGKAAARKRLTPVVPPIPGAMRHEDTLGNYTMTIKMGGVL